MDVGFIRGDREHPVQDAHEAKSHLVMKGWDIIIRLLSESSPWVAPKKSKQWSCKGPTIPIDKSNVPCMVCHYQNLPILFKNGILGNEVA